MAYCLFCSVVNTIIMLTPEQKQKCDWEEEELKTAGSTIPNALRALETYNRKFGHMRNNFLERRVFADFYKEVNKVFSIFKYDQQYWSMKLHLRNLLTNQQCAWVAHLLTVGSRIRLHWRPVNSGPQSVACTPDAGHLPLPCLMK